MNRVPAKVVESRGTQSESLALDPPLSLSLLVGERWQRTRSAPVGGGSPFAASTMNPSSAGPPASEFTPPQMVYAPTAGGHRRWGRRSFIPIHSDEVGALARQPLGEPSPLRLSPSRRLSFRAMEEPSEEAGGGHGGTPAAVRWSLRTPEPGVYVDQGSQGNPTAREADQQLLSASSLTGQRKRVLDKSPEASLLLEYGDTSRAFGIPLAPCLASPATSRTPPSPTTRLSPLQPEPRPSPPQPQPQAPRCWRAHSAAGIRSHGASLLHPTAPPEAAQQGAHPDKACGSWAALQAYYGRAAAGLTRTPPLPQPC